MMGGSSMMGGRSLRRGQSVMRGVTVFSLLAIAAATVHADQFPGEYEIGGWIRADYGNGDRYADADGEDNLGVSQAALLGKWTYENLEAILLLGGTNLTADSTDGDGDVGIKDAFIVWREIGGSGLTLSAGAQPLLFGLKPNGFPGDRSLQPSLEYGGAGGFAVAQQAGPSVILSYAAGDRVTLRGGLFDTSSSTAAYFEATGLGGIDGSSVSKNYFAQLELQSGDEQGVYFALGYEGRYVGDEIDSTEPILDLGVGFKNKWFDLSVEYVQLDRNITRTLDDEAYGIAELTLMPTDRLQLYFDYAEAEERALETLRAGLRYQISKPLNFKFEYSEDELGNGSIDGVDVRLELTF